MKAIERDRILDGFQKSLRPCALDKNSLKMHWKVKVVPYEKLFMCVWRWQSLTIINSRKGKAASLIIIQNQNRVCKRHERPYCFF